MEINITTILQVCTKENMQPAEIISNENGIILHYPNSNTIASLWDLKYKLANYCENPIVITFGSNFTEVFISL